MTEARGLVKHGGLGDMEVSDEPAKVKEEEKAKPKKKKTPEEIEAGKYGILKIIRKFYNVVLS